MCEEIRIGTDEDFVKARYDLESGCFVMTDLFVGSRRRDGIGSELVRSAYLKARELGATSILASITSRSGYETVRSVFGDESVEVTRLGSLEEPDQCGATEAVLCIELADNREPVSAGHMSSQNVSNG